MNRNDLFVDLTMDGWPVGYMFRDDWEALLVAVDPKMDAFELATFIAAQEFRTDVSPKLIAVNVRRHFRDARRWADAS